MTEFEIIQSWFREPVTLSFNFPPPQSISIAGSISASQMQVNLMTLNFTCIVLHSMSTGLMKSVVYYSINANKPNRLSDNSSSQKFMCTSE